MNESGARARVLAVLRWIALGVLVGAFCGTASAIFLVSLEHATRIRESNRWLVYCLPVAGLAIGALYDRFGRSVKGGANLVIDAIHDDGPEIPLRMAPMVLIGTVLTHLFGGSAGREGTAVQMGASLSDALAGRLRLRGPERRALIASGVAGGFGSVFGTPLAGTIFGLEFVVVGRIEYAALLPALVASVTGDLVTRAWGVGHTHYPVPAALALTPLLLAKWTLFAAAVAAVATAFIESLHALKHWGERALPSLPLRMAAGGVAVVAMWLAVGTDDYLGLGVPGIVAAFEDPTRPPWGFALKALFTIVTLGAGFLGGEVTPLFFVGAALGATLAEPLGIPREMAAGVGMAAVFACASNAPLALSIMAVELLGATVLPHVAIVCATAYVVCGHRGIYPAQRVHRAKTDPAPPDPARPPVRLRDLHADAGRTSPRTDGAPGGEG